MKAFLETVNTQFKYYKSLGDKTLDQIADDQLFWQYNPECNSMATMVKHLWGNMLSRWTDFLTSDGEKEWRQREAEFENDIKSWEEMMQKWNEGWNCLFTALNSITTDDLNKIVYIRKEPHTVFEAINRQLPHYAYHIGQMVYLGKMICGSEWKSLSIPKGGTESYNRDKFGRDK
jgi:Protein of unknown function (DUF1572)